MLIAKILSKREIKIWLWFTFLLGFLDWLYDVVSGDFLSVHSVKYIFFAFTIPVIVLVVAFIFYSLTQLHPLLRFTEPASLRSQVTRFCAIMVAVFFGILPAKWVARKLSIAMFDGQHAHLLTTLMLHEIALIGVFFTVIGIIILVFEKRGLFYSVFYFGLLPLSTLLLFSTQLPNNVEAWWLRFNHQMAKNHVANSTSVMLVEIDDWPGRDKFRRLLKLIQLSGAKAIGIAFPIQYRTQLDRAFLDGFDASKIVFGAAVEGYKTEHPLLGLGIQILRPTSFRVYTMLDGQGLVIAGALTVQRQRIPDLLEEFPHYYEPKVDTALSFSTNPTVDFGVRLAQFGREHDKLDAVIKSIPVDHSGRAIVHYYSNYDRFERYPDLNAFTTAWFRPASGLPSEPSDRVFIYSNKEMTSWGVGFPDVYQLVIDPFKEEIRRIPHSFGHSKSIDTNPLKFSQVEEFRDYIVIVSYRDQATTFFPYGLVYATITENILNNDFVAAAPRWVAFLNGLLVTSGFFWVFFRLPLRRSVLLSAMLQMFLIIFCLILFRSHDVFVPSIPIFLPAVFSWIVLIPYEIVHERRRLLEERTTLKAELRAAHDMQMGLMPSQDPVVKGFDISGACIPASEVGGDFYDYVWLDNKKTKLGIALADVSGKAMKAAMTAVMTSGMLYSEASKSKSPREILARINRPLYLRSDRRVFTALSFAALDTKTKKLTYSSAGQSQPILIRDGNLTYLKTQGVRLPLGIKEENKYRDFQLKLRSGDTVVFYTDGVPEAMNTESKFYGFERFEDLLRQHHALGAKELRDKIVENVQSFAGKTEQPDDMTVVVVKVN